MAVDRGDGKEIVFGPFCLSPQDRTLWRDGQRIPLRTKCMDILCALIAAHGDIVTKEELMAAVWRGLIVEDNAIQVHVSMLRKALGEDVGSQRHLITVPGKGYRFIAAPAVHSVLVNFTTTPSTPTDRPSIAVMPFQNMSGDREGDYFADGVVEEIITALTRFSSLFVIARNSSFTYKGRAVDIRQVGRELGVRYLLEGSVRKAENRIRITGLLVDAETGAQIWANRFDSTLVEIFELQDEIASSVVAAITPKLEQVEIERAKRKPTENLQAYDYYLRGLASVHREQDETNSEALRQFYKAIELDPDFASAYGMATWCYSRRQRNGWMTDRVREQAEAKRLALRAAELGRDNAIALSTAGNSIAWFGQEVEAGAELIDRALKLNPNLAFAWYSSAWVHIWLGAPDTAIEHAARAMRLSPLDPLFHAMEAALALAHFIAERYDEAIVWAEKAFRKEKNYHGTIRILAASHVFGGNLDKARAAMACMRERNPALRLAELREIVPLRRQDDRTRYFEGLRIAGLPE
jgi:TolB-like protein